MLAVIAIVILCSPLILGPLIIPAMKQAKTDRALEQLHGKDESLPEGLAIEPLPSDQEVWGGGIYCETQVEANLTQVACGGRLHQVIETRSPGTTPIRIATACFVCGKFEKTSTFSQALGTAYAEIKVLNDFTRAVQSAKRRQHWAKRAA